MSSILGRNLAKTKALKMDSATAAKNHNAFIIRKIKRLFNGVHQVGEPVIPRKFKSIDAEPRKNEKQKFVATSGKKWSRLYRAKEINRAT